MYKGGGLQRRWRRGKVTGISGHRGKLGMFLKYESKMFASPIMILTPAVHTISKLPLDIHCWNKLSNIGFKGISSTVHGAFLYHRFYICVHKGA